MANKSNTECLISIEIEGQNTAFLKPDVEQERRIAIYVYVSGVKVEHWSLG